MGSIPYAFQWLFFLWEDHVPIPLDVMPRAFARLSSDELDVHVRVLEDEKKRAHEALRVEERWRSYETDPTKCMLSLPLGRTPEAVSTDVRTVAYFMRQRERMLAASS